MNSSCLSKINPYLCWTIPIRMNNVAVAPAQPNGWKLSPKTFDCLFHEMENQWKRKYVWDWLKSSTSLILLSYFPVDFFGWTNQIWPFYHFAWCLLPFRAAFASHFISGKLNISQIWSVINRSHLGLCAHVTTNRGFCLFVSLVMRRMTKWWWEREEERERVRERGKKSEREREENEKWKVFESTLKLCTLRWATLDCVVEKRIYQMEANNCLHCSSYMNVCVCMF